MPGTPSPAYACGCLNVRITPAPSATPSSEPLPSTSDFTLVHVADEGISLAHPQVTMRVRTRGELTSRNWRARYTSLTCLVCHVLVYRVHQVVSLDADGRDGPLMPTEDWVEQDILKSPTGWIEVHKECIAGGAIARAEASPRYSALFSLAIPISASAPASPQPLVDDGPQMPYLAHLPPLFLPPPFTPGHPVFVRLASIAQAESEAQRAALENDIAEVVRAKSAQLAQSEALLRRQVETVYRKFREGLQFVEQTETGSLASPRSPRSPSSSSSTGRAASMGPSSPTVTGTPAAADYGFIPLPVGPSRPERPAAISALSASLITSEMHHPREQLGHLGPRSPTRPESTRSAESRTLSGSSVTLAGSLHAQPRARDFDGGASLLHIPRNMDEDMNTAASHQLFRNIEQDVAQSRQERRLRESERVPMASTSAPQPVAEPSSRAGPSTVNGRKNEVEASHGEVTTREREAGVKDKGKRKMVTFEPQPEVVTIKREVTAEKEEEDRRARYEGEELVFDLETDNRGSTPAEEGVVMMLVEQPAQPRPSQPRRPSGRKLSIDSAGLPQSFSALRPASLPNPSNFPRRSPPMNDIVEVSAHDEDDGQAGEEEAEEQEQEEEEEYNSQDLHILKLVAANNPSHRGAWKKGGAKWMALVGRNDGRPNFDDEDEGGNPPPAPHLNGIASSMPIAIRPLVRPPVRLTLASYRPEIALPTIPEPEPPTVSLSSSVRNAIYAERDIQRSIDPGALDFAVDNGSIIEEEDQDESPGANGQTAAGSSSAGPRRMRSGRDVALRILQARNELPDSARHLL